MRGFKRNKVASDGVSTRCITFLCIFSFFCGYLVAKRFQAVFEAVKMEGRLLYFDKQGDVNFRPLINWDSRDSSYKASNAFPQISQTHNLLLKLDKAKSSVKMHLSAAKASRVHEEMSSPTATKQVVEQQRDRPTIFFVMGIITAFSSRKRRDSLRESWMPQGEQLHKLEKEKGIVVRFVIGHSASIGGVHDRAIDAEEIQHKDFLRLDHLEGYHELSLKTQTYFSTAMAKWVAEFYIKVEDDVHINLGMVVSALARQLSKPRVYIGCMKSGFVLSQKLVVHRYANEDVSLGSWLIGLDVNHVDDRSLYCETTIDCEWKAQAGNPCAASFDWSCSGVCKSVGRMKEVHQRCGEVDGAHTSF